MIPILGSLFAAAITCTSPHVADGDTLTCSGVRVRLFGIDAPELHGLRCRGGDTIWACDPAALRYGPAAADRLFDLTRGQVRCVKVDTDRYRRVVARCSGRGTPDLGRQMVRDGLARDYERYSHGDYAVEELRARRQRVGMLRP